MLCKNQVSGGYDDWFLPSKDELYLMYSNLKVNSRGSFESGWYWSSSEVDYQTAWFQDFDSGSQEYDFKDFPFYVRAVRAF